MKKKSQKIDSIEGLAMFIQNEVIGRMVTKDEAKSFATKNDLLAMESRIDERLVGIENRLSALENRVFMLENRIIEAHERRIRALEVKLRS